MINGCYSTRTGALRVIDYPSHHCASGEKFLRWNQTSAAGAVPLLALQGTACSSIGAQGTLSLAVDAGTGAVTLVCKTLLKVQSAVRLSTIDIFTNSTGARAVECVNATACSIRLAYGSAGVRVTIGSASNFYYTCPGGTIAQGATPDVTRTLFQATCSGIAMTSDRTVAVTAPPQ